jgi:hypothetical protein
LLSRDFAIQLPCQGPSGIEPSLALVPLESANWFGLIPCLKSTIPALPCRFLAGVGMISLPPVGRFPDDKCSVTPSALDPEVELSHEGSNPKGVDKSEANADGEGVGPCGPGSVIAITQRRRNLGFVLSPGLGSTSAARCRSSKPAGPPLEWTPGGGTF